MLYDCRPPSLPPKPKKRRIGRNPVIGQPKLFGGNLEEYIEVYIGVNKTCMYTHIHPYTWLPLTWKVRELFHSLLVVVHYKISYKWIRHRFVF